MSNKQPWFDNFLASIGEHGRAMLGILFAVLVLAFALFFFLPLMLMFMVVMLGIILLLVVGFAGNQLLGGSIDVKTDDEVIGHLKNFSFHPLETEDEKH